MIVKTIFCAMSQLAVIYVRSFTKLMKVMVHVIRGEKCDVTIAVCLVFQKRFTANRDIAQKNGFRYHNLFFLLNLR